MMDAKKTRAEYKRRRTVAIKKLRQAGLSETEIQTELAKIREELGNSGSDSDSRESAENLPAVIESEDRQGSARRKEKTFPPKPGRDEYGNSTNAEKVAHWDEGLSNNSERRCGATNAKGEQCRKYAIPGAKVCKVHGGATRHVRDKARVRLEMASNRLVGKLVEIAFDDTRPAAVQLDAIKDSLNRAGLSKPAQVEVGPIKPYEEIFDSISTYRPGSEPESIEGKQDLMVSPASDQPPKYVDYQDNWSESDAPTDVPDADLSYRRHPSGDGREPSDCDPPSATDRRVRRDRDRYHQRPHVTGDDAYRAANEANRQVGALPALPPGRSTGW